MNILLFLDGPSEIKTLSGKETRFVRASPSTQELGFKKINVVCSSVKSVRSFLFPWKTTELSTFWKIRAEVILPSGKSFTALVTTRSSFNKAVDLAVVEVTRKVLQAKLDALERRKIV